MKTGLFVEILRFRLLILNERNNRRRATKSGQLIIGSTWFGPPIRTLGHQEYSYLKSRIINIIKKKTKLDSKFRIVAYFVDKFHLLRTKLTKLNDSQKFINNSIYVGLYKL